MDKKQFEKDRLKALLSLDKDKILAYIKKYNIQHMPTNEKMFWVAIHKARAALQDIPINERVKSANWLKARGYRLVSYEYLMSLRKEDSD